VYCAWSPCLCGAVTMRRPTSEATAEPKSRRTMCKHESAGDVQPKAVGTAQDAAGGVAERQLVPFRRQVAAIAAEHLARYGECEHRRTLQDRNTHSPPYGIGHAQI
jgi:hypothetical protein